MINGHYSTSYSNNLKSHLNESFGIIFRQKNTIKHSKGLTKICFIDDSHFLTGSKDSVIKLWKNCDEEVN